MIPRRVLCNGLSCQMLQQGGRGFGGGLRFGDRDFAQQHEGEQYDEDDDSFDDIDGFLVNVI